MSANIIRIIRSFDSTTIVVVIFKVLRNLFHGKFYYTELKQNRITSSFLHLSHGGTFELLGNGMFVYFGAK